MPHKAVFIIVTLLGAGFLYIYFVTFRDVLRYSAFSQHGSLTTIQLRECEENRQQPVESTVGEHDSSEWKNLWTNQCAKKIALVRENDDNATRFAPDVEKKTRLVFLKTHKTGSSTVQNILFRFGERNNLTFVFPAIGNHVLRKQPVPPWLLPCERAKPDVFCLHTDYKTQDLAAAVKPNATWFTILRNPDYLFESLYRYYQLNNYFRKPFTSFLQEPPRDANRIITTSNVGLGVNQLIRDLGLDFLSTTNESAVSLYIDYLGETYDFFMITERMDESLILLRHLLGWDLLDILSLSANQRSAKSRDPLGDLNDVQRENLRNLNSADHMLYDRFKGEFERRVEDFGAERMEAELDAYRCLKDAIYAACNFERYPARELPKMFQTLGDTVGYFPTLPATSPAELMWTCNRLAYSEVPYVEQLRMQQRYVTSKSERSQC